MTEESTTSAKLDRGGARSFPVVMGVFVALLALGVLGAVAIHRRFIGFERVVAHHVPADATVAVRWDVEKVTLFEPTRRFLLPLFDEAPTDDLDPGDRSRRRRLARESGLEIGRDLREVLAVLGPEPGDWAVVLGGSFPKTGVADAVERTLRDEGRTVTRLDGERLSTAQGIAFGRAPDGALVVASSRTRLEATSGTQPPVDAIPRTGAGAFFIRPDAPGLSPDAKVVLSELGGAVRVEAVASWGTPLIVDATVHYRPQAPRDALAGARRALERLLGPGPIPPVELVRETAGPDPNITFRVRLND
ncbi:MAG TPA: hypothetical protein VF103_00520, partial [Polyangiaceae bacterium]